jgi:hypothetical protein
MFSEPFVCQHEHIHLNVFVMNWASKKISVPDLEAGCCLGPEGNGVSLREEGEGGPGPPGGGKDKQSVLSEGRDNMGKDEEDRTSRT